VCRNRDHQQPEDPLEVLVADDFAHQLHETLLLLLTLDFLLILTGTELLHPTDEEEDDEPTQRCQRREEQKQRDVATGVLVCQNLINGRLVREWPAEEVNRDHEDRTDIHRQVPHVVSSTLRLLVRKPLGARHDHRGHETDTEGHDDVGDDQQRLADRCGTEGVGSHADPEHADRDDSRRDERRLAVTELVDDRPEDDHERRVAEDEHAEEYAGRFVAEAGILARVERADRSEGEVHEHEQHVQPLGRPELKGKPHQLPELAEVIFYGFQHDFRLLLSAPLSLFRCVRSTRVFAPRIHYRFLTPAAPWRVEIRIWTTGSGGNPPPTSDLDP